MAKTKTVFYCTHCGYESAKWLGRCPGCGEWNTFVEETVTAGAQNKEKTGHQLSPVPITEIEISKEERFSTGFAELDRVLGGGVVPGSLILLGGDPGIGKSTLLLQAAHAMAQAGRKVLYATAEESARQTRLRAERVGALSKKLLLLPETDLLRITHFVDKEAADVLIVDSIQTVFHPDLSSAPGSVSQVRECTGQLLRLAKEKGSAVFIVGHVTKEGAIAGPRLLEHMVDAVLYFEGERHHTYRILRGVKNRFGSTNELGIFEMREEGMTEIANPSEIFISSPAKGEAGSVVVASIEGTRPVLVEIQALLTPTAFGLPRRMTNGFDLNRLNLLLAVLDKRVGLHVGNYDAYLNVAGGIRLEEPAVDLAVILAVASSFREIPVLSGVVVFGEVGLTGEVRPVSRVEPRLKEAAKLGFRYAILPAGQGQDLISPGLELVPVESVMEAIQYAFGR